MKFPHIFKNLAALTLVLATLAATAQTVISNETLVSTTFVVNKTPATAVCTGFGCSAKNSMFSPVSVACPAATGGTCTFHIFLDTKVSIRNTNQQSGPGPAGSYQFLVDGIAPTIGPTDTNGNYDFEANAYTTGVPISAAARLSYPASVLTTVTNSGSNNHTIVVSIACSDVQKEGGCEATAHWTTMRVDVFEP